MFNELLKLYIKNTSKTPLEDFTTEAFVGLLKMNEDIKNDFILNFLGLAPDTYFLRTQVYYKLENDQNCIVDFVIEGKNNICFIENKVNSTEGWRQLERYSLVLDTFKDEKDTRLFFCTKYPESKNIAGHNFKCIRWYQIANFLTRYQSNQLVSSFSNFLKTNKMAQELTLTSLDFVAFESLQKAIHLVNEYLEKERPIFKEKFKNHQKISDYRTLPQIREHNRMAFLYKEIFKSEKNAWSEIIYGFSFEVPSIFVNIYIDKSHEQHDIVIKEAEKCEKFTLIRQEIGTQITLIANISMYLNDKDADGKISKWFGESFDYFESFKSNSKNITWT